MWHRPYIIKGVLQKGAYKLVEYDRTPLKSLGTESSLKITMLRVILPNALYIIIP